MTVFKILQFWVTIEKFGASTCHSFRILEMVIEALQIRFSEKSSGWALRLDFIKIETLKRKNVKLFWMLPKNLSKFQWGSICVWKLLGYSHLNVLSEYCFTRSLGKWTMVPSCFFSEFLAPNQLSKNILPHLISNRHNNKTSFCKLILDKVK